MRVTNTMLSTRLLTDLDQIRERMYRLETDISTGVWLHRPSDSPADALAVMRHQEALERVKRYQANMSDAKAWMATTEKAIADLIEMVHRARELTVQGASDTNSSQSRESIREEILELRRYAVQVGNAKYNGQYVFSGLGTDEPAFVEDPVTGTVTYRLQPGHASNPAGETGYLGGTYTGVSAATLEVRVTAVDANSNVTDVEVSWDGSTWTPVGVVEGGTPVSVGNGMYFSLPQTGRVNDVGDTWTFRLPQSLLREVGPGNWVRINVTGDVLGGVITDTGQPRDDDLFAVLQTIAAALATGDRSTLDTAVGRLDSVLNRLLAVQAQLGAKQRTLDFNEQRTLDLQVTLEGQLEGARGTDMERAVLDFNKARSAYEAALAMGARILPPTLLDYLR